MAETERIRIGGYELIERLALLDQCRLYRAQCVDDQRPQVAHGEMVALTVFNRVREDSESCARFERMAGVLLSLSHPHLVRYLDAFKWKRHDRQRERLPCMAIELPEGELLASRLPARERPLSRGEQARALSQTLDALLAVREHRLLPRHFTTRNIYLCASGEVRVLGLGTPRVQNDQGATVVGDAHFFQYLPPEFAGGEVQGDECSLVYSLGVCFYEIITGHLPFPRLPDRRARSECFRGPGSAFRNRWRTDTPPQPDLAPAILQEAPALKAFLARALAVDRGARFPDLVAMQAALPAALASWAPTAGPAPPPPTRSAPKPQRQDRRPHLAVAAGTALLAVLGLAVGVRLVRAPGRAPRAADASATRPAVRSTPDVVPPAPTTAKPAPPATPTLTAVLSAQPLPNPEPMPAAATETVATPRAPSEPAPPPPWSGKAVVEVYLEKTPPNEPATEMAYRAADGKTWQPVTAEMELDPGVYAFRFTRTDFEPATKTVVVDEGARGAFVTSPGLQDWVATPALNDLHRLRAAWSAHDLDRVAREFARPNRPALAWPPHAAEYDRIRNEWFGALKRNTLAVRLGSIAFAVELESPPAGEAPVRTVYRKQEGKRWVVLTEQALVQPGQYDLRFLRPDYRTIARTVKVVSGNKSFTVNGPRLADWEPGPALVELLLLEEALREGNMEQLTAHLARPQGHTLKSQAHVQRLEQVREAWYSRLKGRLTSVEAPSGS